jgi:hypothetical protein
MKSVIPALFAFVLFLPMAASAQEAQIVNVQQTEIKRIAGEVVQVRGTLLTLRHEGGGRETYRIPRGASISIQGESIRLQDLQPGQQIRVYYRETSEGRVIVLSPPSGHREPANVVDEKPAEVSVEPQPEKALPATLPATASPVPLIGALGLLFVTLGVGISGLRRRR